MIPPFMRAGVPETEPGAPDIPTQQLGLDAGGRAGHPKKVSGRQRVGLLMKKAQKIAA